MLRAYNDDDLAPRSYHTDARTPVVAMTSRHFLSMNIVVRSSYSVLPTQLLARTILSTVFLKKLRPAYINILQ